MKRKKRGEDEESDVEVKIQPDVGSGVTFLAVLKGGACEAEWWRTRLGFPVKWRCELERAARTTPFPLSISWRILRPQLLRRLHVVCIQQYCETFHYFSPVFWALNHGEWLRSSFRQLQTIRVALVPSRCYLHFNKRARRVPLKSENILINSSL